MNSTQNQSYYQNSQYPYQQTSLPHRPPVNPKLKIKKPTLKINTLTASTDSPSMMNNYLRNQSHSTNNYHNTQGNPHQQQQQSFVFSFGGNSPSIHLRNNGPNHLSNSMNLSTSGLKSMTPTQQKSMLKKLDFYGRKMKHDEMDDLINNQHKRQSSLPSDINPLHLSNTNQHFHDTIELELRSQLDLAKNDLTSISQNIQSQIKKELNKYPQLANEESDIARSFKDLQSKFEIFEGEIVRRTKDLLRSYKILKQENQSIMKRLSESISNREVEMKYETIKSELEDQIIKAKEDLQSQVNLDMQNQMRSLRFEIEGSILKKIRAKQSQEEKKMEDFYKFKADVYQYLDNKYENLDTIYANKFKTLFEFTDRADDRLRVLWDQKTQNDFNFEDFKTKQHHKLEMTEDLAKEASNKVTHMESQITDHHNYIMRLKKALQQLQKDQSIPLRIEALEKRMSDQDMKDLINLQIDLSVNDRLKQYSESNELIINNIEKDMIIIKQQQTKGELDINKRIESLMNQLNNNHNHKEMLDKIEEDNNLKLQVLTDQLKNLHLNFEQKQTEHEQIFTKSFNDIKQIVVSKMNDFDKKTLLQDERLITMESQVQDVQQKYEHFYELFTNIVQEMQTTEEDEDGSGSVENNQQQQQQQQQNLINQIEMIEDYGSNDNASFTSKVLKLQEKEIRQENAKILIEGDLNSKSLHKNQIEDQSIEKIQLQTKKLHLSSPSRNKIPQRQSNSMNSSLPLFMISHIQNQKNKIYIENSPERKTHDNMLISPKKRGIKPFNFNDEVNVLEKIKSSQLMHPELFNEIWIAKQEKMIKAYTPKFQENQQRMANSTHIQTKRIGQTELIEIEDEECSIQVQLKRDFYYEDIKSEVVSDSSSSYIYEMVDQSITQNDNVVTINKQRELNQNNKKVDYYEEMRKKKSFKSIISEEEINDLYEYSEDDDEEIYPFEQSPRDNEETKSPQFKHISVIDSSAMQTTTQKKENPLEKLLRTTAKLQKDQQERQLQQSQITTNFKVNPLIDDEESSNRHSLTPLGDKLNFYDDQPGYPQSFEQNKSKKIKKITSSLEENEEMNDIYLEICAKFVAEEIDNIFRNSIRRK